MTVNGSSRNDVRVTITMPPDLLKQLQRIAKQTDRTMSATIREAARLLLREDELFRPGVHVRDARKR